MTELINHDGEIWLVVMPVDCRRGINGLSSQVEHLGFSPCKGAVLVFRNAAGNRLKILRWDGNGVWLWQRRLHRGSFIWPKTEKSLFQMTFAQWQWLVIGVDWQRLNPTLEGFLKT